MSDEAAAVLVMTPDTRDARQAAVQRAAEGLPLTPGEMAAIYHVGPDQFSRMAKAGKFDQFLLKPAIGRAHYSGVKVYRHLIGDPIYEPTFGRKR